MTCDLFMKAGDKTIWTPNLSYKAQSVRIVLLPAFVSNPIVTEKILALLGVNTF